MKSSIEIKTQRREFNDFVSTALPRLKQMKQKGDRIAFNRLMRNILPGVKLYIARRLRTSVKNRYIPAGKYKVEDFADELYIMAYDHIHELKEDQRLHIWLFKKADELLEDIIVEEDFDHTFYENIDNFRRFEWDEMEEKFSTDGGGDLVMEEELDDTSYPKNDYTLRDVFVENTEEELIKKLDKELTEEKIHQHIDMVLHHLPLEMRTIFDLAVNEHFLPEEIADIKQISVVQVEQYLESAKKFLRMSFEGR